MIERLTTTLLALADPEPAALSAPAGRRLVGDCADALRLTLDCPQQNLTAGQRAELHRLNDLLDAGGTRPAELSAAARAACRMLGLALPRSAAGA